MTKTWFASDLHLGHASTVEKFKRPDGSPLRPFKDVEHHDTYLIEKWNSLVDDKDRVYLLGDCVINRRFLPRLNELKGRIVLTPGNHCIFNLKKEYPQHWEIRGYVVKPKAPFIACHIPLHPDTVGRFGVNITGHLHYNVINSPQYINVSMEQIQFKPISYDDLKERIEENFWTYCKTGQVINFADRKFDPYE